MEHSIRAAELFESGYNCAQAVAIAFTDLTGYSESEMARLASPFGGGIGRMREICGAVSGMFMVLGILYGYEGGSTDEDKKQLYSDVQALAGKFRIEVGSIICREILKNPPSDPMPSARTEEFYKTRPCTRMVMLAATLMDKFIMGHPITE